MKRSTDRILTTHMGSLPRPEMRADLLVAQAEGKEVDAARIPALTDEAMDHVCRQLDCGIDVGNDGEMPRRTFFVHRAHVGLRRPLEPPIPDMQRFPKWGQNYQARRPPAQRLRLPGRDRPGALQEPGRRPAQCGGRTRRLRPRAMRGGAAIASKRL